MGNYISVLLCKIVTGWNRNVLTDNMYNVLLEISGI